MKIKANIEKNKLNPIKLEMKQASGILLPTKFRVIQMNYEFRNKYF